MSQQTRRRHTGDPYQILGVSRSADPREIRAAYRRLAKTAHPDVNSAPDAAEQMARINWAYSVVSEHARREGQRAYRGTAQSHAQRGGRVRWFVRERPPPRGGRLVAETRQVTLVGQRGENANVEGIAMVRNDGTGPLEGEVQATPSWVIVRPKSFTLEANESQMFRISVPNRYCSDSQREATLSFESNGGDARVSVRLPSASDVLIALEPAVIDLGDLRPGERREARLRLSYRGVGTPRVSVASDAAWLEVRATSLPRRTQYYRVTAQAPDALGAARARVTVDIGGATASTLVRLNVVENDDEREGERDD